MVEAISGGKISRLPGRKERPSRFRIWEDRWTPEVSGFGERRGDWLLSFLRGRAWWKERSAAAQFSFLTLDQKSSKYFCKHPKIKLCRQRYLPWGPCPNFFIYPETGMPVWGGGGLSLARIFYWRNWRFFFYALWGSFTVGGMFQGLQKRRNFESFMALSVDGKIYFRGSRGRRRVWRKKGAMVPSTTS